jgi:hypothetical protein
MRRAQVGTRHTPVNHRGSKLVNSPPNTPTLGGTSTDFSFAFTISTVRPVFKNRAINSLRAMARWWAVKVSCRSKPVTAFRMTWARGGQEPGDGDRWANSGAPPQLTTTAKTNPKCLPNTGGASGETRDSAGSGALPHTFNRVLMNTTLNAATISRTWDRKYCRANCRHTSPSWVTSSRPPLNTPWDLINDVSFWAAREHHTHVVHHAHIHTNGRAKAKNMAREAGQGRAGLRHQRRCRAAAEQSVIRPLSHRHPHIASPDITPTLHDTAPINHSLAKGPTRPHLHTEAPNDPAAGVAAQARGVRGRAGVQWHFIVSRCHAAQGLPIVPHGAATPGVVGGRSNG